MPSESRNSEVTFEEEGAMSCGTPLTSWQRTVIAEWHRRHPNPIAGEFGYLKVRMVPRGCWCARCKAQAVMFPGDSTEFPENKGYCICPKCSAQKRQEAA